MSSNTRDLNRVTAGLGFAATRDFISFLRNSNGTSTGKCGRKHDDEERGRGRDEGSNADALRNNELAKSLYLGA
jgi:hypothetical protein